MNCDIYLPCLRFSSGTVGLSLGIEAHILGVSPILTLFLGYPTINTSLSGTFSTFSKLVIIAMEVNSPAVQSR